MKTLFSDSQYVVLYEEANLMHVVEYARLTNKSGGQTVEYWLVKRGDQHYVLKYGRGGMLEIGVEGSGDLQHCRHIFDLEVENTIKATGLFHLPFTIETRKLDPGATKRLKVFDSPMVDIDWGKAPGGTTASEQFLQLLRRQLRGWKGTSNSLPVTKHREWADFHKRVVKAVRSKYGNQVVLYRGVRNVVAKRVLDGGVLPIRKYSAWTPELSAARVYSAKAAHKTGIWAVVKATFKPESIALAPVHLPDYDDPNVLDPLAHDVEHVGDELIVRWGRKSIPSNRITIAAKTKREP